MPETVSPRCQNPRIERLFDLEDSPGGRSNVPSANLPLAARMRPASLGEFVGQDHLLGRGSALRTAIEEGRPHSMILYGPPGTGKTTLARLLAVNSRAAFEEASAVNAGRAEVREVIQRAQHRRDTSGERTIFFLDEIHRFNKAQQDTLLPAVEEGLVVLVGATTENPYFEVNSALLSRCRVYELRALDDEHVLALLRRSLGDDRGISGAPRVDDDALEFLAARSAGDARTALSALELACETVGENGTVTLRVAEDALQRSAILYDKGGDLHYDLISAWIKATRGSDPDASLLYLAAMLEGGEDPRFIARRMVVFASEDIGNADPRALEVAVNAAHAVEHVGMPECALNLAQAAVYLALAPKSNASYEGIKRARAWVREHGTPEPPAALRSAAYPGATKLGRGLDYDREGDRHYDFVSAWIKATRGSDVDASLYYLAVMLEGGEDPRFIARRMVILASEDVGNADPRALLVADAAARAVDRVGLPECALNLAQAAVYLALAPKSNASHKALSAARAEVRANGAKTPPDYLRDAHYPGAGKLGRGEGYRYAHDEPGGVSDQPLMPPGLEGLRFYKPTDRGFEEELGRRLEALRKRLSQDQTNP